MLNPKQLVKTFTASEEEKKEAKVQEIRANALQKAIEDFNIVRINNVNYVTHLGIPVSIEEDSNGDMCERLEKYRQNYVDACEKASKLLCDKIY